MEVIETKCFCCFVNMFFSEKQRKPIFQKNLQTKKSIHEHIKERFSKVLCNGLKQRLFSMYPSAF